MVPTAAAARPRAQGRDLRLVTDVVLSAKTARLRYVCDTGPGIRRAKKGTGFFYVGSDGKTVRDAAVLKRIRSLVIPPAWQDVWICSDPDGHVQAGEEGAVTSERCRLTGDELEERMKLEVFDVRHAVTDVGDAREPFGEDPRE